MKRTLLILAVVAALFALAPEAHAAGFCSPFTNCFRDSDCGGVGGWCRNRVCHCPGSEDPGFCANRCDSMPYCPPGVASCGGHSVQVNGSTVHVTDCRGIGSGRGGGVISYCSQTAPPPTPTPTPPPTPTPVATPAIPAGTITGRCTGWPAPRVEIRWSASSPPGQLPPNSNSILRGVDGGAMWWMFGGNLSSPLGGYDSRRISGATACGSNPCRTVTPNMTVYDLRDDAVTAGSTYEYKVKYRPELPSSNTYSVTVDAANCGGPLGTVPPQVPTVSLSANPGAVFVGDTTQLTWSSTNSVACSATGAWSGPKGLNGTQSVAVPASSVYTLSCVNTGGVSRSASATVPAHGPPGQGRIVGFCTGGSSPQVHLWWSATPPDGGTADRNEIEKGDSYPSEPALYWGTMSGTSAGRYRLTDAGVVSNTQYQYRVRYRGNMVSANTYTIFTSSENCGGPPPTPGPLAISPASQIVPPNVTAFFTATGGDGRNFQWAATQGTPSIGTGPQFSAAFTNGSLSPETRTVTVTSGGQTAQAQVQVQGISTFSDDIDLTGNPSYWVRIDGGASSTPDRQVNLTFAHGWDTVATSSVTMRVARSAAELSSAPDQPFVGAMGWNLCGSAPDCPGDLYEVHVRYSAPGVSSRNAVDTIVLLGVQQTAGAESVTINGGAASTTTRTATLTLEHGFMAPDDEVVMRVANDQADLTAQQWQVYAPSLPWDLCLGLGTGCSGGTHTVYTEFVYGAASPTQASDSITLSTSLPLWGVLIDSDAATTEDADVTLSFNPVFNIPDTVIEIANDPSFTAPQQFLFPDAGPWNLCAGLATCPPGDQRIVYVRYLNPTHPEWATTPYQDDIVFGVAGTPTPVPGAPAAVLINDGDLVTDSRYVTLELNSPYADPGVTVRTVNDDDLTPKDRETVAANDGGIRSEPPIRQEVIETVVPRGELPVTLTPTPQTAPQTQAGGAPAPLRADDAVTELEAGTVRVYTPEIANWDLCSGAPDCPYGIYRVYAQYYRPAAVGGTLGAVSALAALGDEASAVYVDDIIYGPATSPTPTPSASVTPTPSVSVTPTPTGTATPVPSGTPSGTPAGSPGPTPTDTAMPSPTVSPTSSPSVLPDFLSPVTRILSEALGGSEPVIRPISLASAAVVVASGIAALGTVTASASGVGVVAFAWQWFMGVLGLLPKRKKTWGTVYDANTKRPIPFAKVQLVDRSRRVLETRIADKEGRYGFLTTPESLLAQNVQIAIVPVVSGYSFPSRTPATVDSFVYANLYYGDLIEVRPDTLINFDVPMDPLKPSAAPLAVKSPSIAVGASVAAIADAGFWVGLVVVPLNFLLVPNPWTLGVLFLFLGAASLRIWGISEHPFGTVTDARTGKPVPFALITVNDLTGKRVAFSVSDEKGRYFLVVEKGSYAVSVYTPADVIPPRQYQGTISAKKGWITREIKL